MALSEQATIVYLCSTPYAPGREHRVHPLDRTVNPPHAPLTSPFQSQRHAAGGGYRGHDRWGAFCGHLSLHSPSSRPPPRLYLSGRRPGCRRTSTPSSYPAERLAEEGRSRYLVLSRGQREPSRDWRAELRFRRCYTDPIYGVTTPLPLAMSPGYDR